MSSHVNVASTTKLHPTLIVDERGADAIMVMMVWLSYCQRTIGVPPGCFASSLCLLIITPLMHETHVYTFIRSVELQAVHQVEALQRLAEKPAHHEDVFAEAEKSTHHG